MTPQEHQQLLEQLAWIRALAGRLVGDPNVADDVLQSACLVALEKRAADMPENHSWRAWVSAITRTLARHAGRAERRRTRRERVAARPEALPATVDVAAQREVLHELVDVVAQLPEPHASVIILRYYDGLSVTEMAERLGLTRVSVRQRLTRARRHLRGQLERRMGSDRERWLAALGPLATGLPTAAPAASLLSTTGGLVMTKTATLVTWKLAIAAGVVTTAAFAAWHVLDDPAPPTPTSDVVVDRSPVRPEPLPAALAPRPQAAAERLEVAEFDSQPVEAEMPAATESEPANAALSAGTTQLDQAALSCLTDTPDLLALTRALWELAQSATVVEDSVAHNPNDGSVEGWLAIAGSDGLASFSIQADGRYSIKLETMAPEAMVPPYLKRALSVSFRDDQGTLDKAGVSLQFWPNTSVQDMPALLERLADGKEQHVGWSLAIGMAGTTGRPISMQHAGDKPAVVITAQGELPRLDAPWATDTSAHEAWFAVLSPHAP